MSKELIQQAIQEVALARVHIESTFIDDSLTPDLLAQQARTHGLLSKGLLHLQEALSTTLPAVQERPKPRRAQPKPESARRNERRRRAAKQPPKQVTATMTTVAEGLGVECPRCGAQPGEFCVVMTHGRNSKRTNKILAHNGGTHADRRRAAAEAKRKGTLVPWEPVPVVDDPVQASEYQSEQDFIEAVEASGSGGDMVVVDWEAADMDRVRNLIDLS